MPATKPTVTLTDAVTFVYVLLLASVNDTVAVFVITVPSGGGDCARSVEADAASSSALASVVSPADRIRFQIMTLSWSSLGCYFACTSYSAWICAPFGTSPRTVQRTWVYM